MGELTDILKQSTILIQSGPRHDPEREHLHIVLNDPVHVPAPIAYGSLANPGEYVQLVSLSSCKPELEYDATCVLDRGHHGWITKQSFVAYSYTRIVPVRALTLGVETQEMRPHDQMCDEVFWRVYDGVAVSDETPLKMLNFWNHYSLKAVS